MFFKGVSVFEFDFTDNNVETSSIFKNELIKWITQCSQKIQKETCIGTNCPTSIGQAKYTPKNYKTQHTAYH
jgi:hypothetical protein